MRIIGAGLPRTATTTQKVALELLGLSTYHMVDLMSDYSHLPLWHAAADGDNSVWDELMAGRDATVDWPGARFYGPLMDKYPEAKVLLSVRNHESWERSMRETICPIYFGDQLMHHLAEARRHVDPNWAEWLRLMNRIVWEAPLNDAPETTEGLIRSAKRWDDEVKATVPADRLLVWEAKEGWEPICEFFGLEKPDAEFPNVNDKAGFQQGIMGGTINAISSWWESNQPGVEATTAS